MPASGCCATFTEQRSETRSEGNRQRRCHVRHALTGLDGERANTGVIAVTDRPWKAALAEMMKTNYDIYKVWLGEREPFAWKDPRVNTAR